jgi:hypothetical protein
VWGFSLGKLGIFGQEIPNGINDRDDIVCSSVSCVIL